jgi:NAD(P)-dependent dehydrogenase (short-subunit alcohol dehydrogenase family)
VLNKFCLKGKTALITGGVVFLGMKHAAALLESGAEVILMGTEYTSLCSARDLLSEYFDRTNITTAVMDVSQRDAISSVSEQLSSNGIQIDKMVNIAIIDPKVNRALWVLEASRLKNFPLNQWNLQVAFRLNGAFFCSQVFGTKMAKEGKAGVLLNIFSDLSVFSPDQRLYSIEGPPVKKRLLSYATSMACSSVRRLVSCCRARSGRRQLHIAGMCMKIFEQSHASSLGRHLDDAATTGGVWKLGDGQGKT